MATTKNENQNKAQQRRVKFDVVDSVLKRRLGPKPNSSPCYYTDADGEIKFCSEMKEAPIRKSTKNVLAKQMKRKIPVSKQKSAADETQLPVVKQKPRALEKISDAKPIYWGRHARYVSHNVQVPLNLGWERKIVHRAAPSIKNVKTDIYYYPPNGKRLRSMKDIDKYMKLTGDDSVKMEMFSYVKERITVHPNETVWQVEKPEN